MRGKGMYGMRSVLLLLILSLSGTYGSGDAPLPVEDIDSVLVAFTILSVAPLCRPDTASTFVPAPSS